MPLVVSGLAAAIRGATESETFDLAGSNTVTIEHVIRDAFSDPFSLADMIRITFVTGAGKLGRQRYDEGAAKAVTMTLRELGYEEDRGASAVMECAGSFKLQHDTGKNLKTVVVFPKIVASKESGDVTSVHASLIAENSPEFKLAYSTMSTFESNIPRFCSSWSQKKGCIAALQTVMDTVKGLDEKLMQGTALDETEQDFYDNVSLRSLEEKIARVKDLLHRHIEEGKLTAEEKLVLILQIKEKLATADKDITIAQNEGKLKRVENLEAAKGKTQERLSKLEKIDPVPTHPLKHQAEINTLRKEMIPLLEVEEGAKGRLLTLKENQAMARKDDIMLEIRDLEVSTVVCLYVCAGRRA
jgi:hypothetical protein